MFILKGEERMATWGGGGHSQTKILVLANAMETTRIID